MPDLAGHHGMIGIGGVFLAVVGAAILVAAPYPRWRQGSLWLGMLLGATAALASAPAFLSPPPPTVVQFASLGLAVAVEVVAFVTSMPRLHRIGERAVTSGTLTIVGGHFLIMLPAFGFWIAILGVLAVVNGLLAGFTRYPLNLAWGVDGAVKLGVGLAMMLGLPASP